MLFRHPDVAATVIGNQFILENDELRLNFSADSARLCSAIWDRLEKTDSMQQLSASTGYSVASIERLIDMLCDDDFVLDGRFGDLIDAGDAIAKIRRIGAFWNRHVMCQPFPRSLFAGKALPHQVMGWGIEFYIFVKAAREYMARGASRIEGSTQPLSGLWDHFAEEAFHDEIFRQGLLACGITRGNIDNRVALPSTVALLNYLWEASEASELEYASVFALMQPSATPPSMTDVTEKYAQLKQWYPFAAPLFDAFCKHDSIDVYLEHSVLTIEPLLRERAFISAGEMKRISGTIRRTAEFFNIFFLGVQSFYLTELNVAYRQVPRINGVLMNGNRIN